MPAGNKMDQLINERFYGEDRPRNWSQLDRDAVVLMLDLAERCKDGDLRIQHYATDGWSVGNCYAGPLEEWVYGETFRLAVCRAALLIAYTEPAAA